MKQFRVVVEVVLAQGQEPADLIDGCDTWEEVENAAIVIARQEIDGRCNTERYENPEPTHSVVSAHIEDVPEGEEWT